MNKCNKCLAVIALIGVAGAVQTVARPSFDRSKDLLLIQYDAEIDNDDIHCIVASACMKLHSDMDGIDDYIVTGARRRTTTTGVKGHELLENIYGDEGPKWTSAWRDWTMSVNRVRDLVKPIIDAGGRVWVQEGGQSDFTADWCRALEAQGISKATLKSRVIVVQHSFANENYATAVDLEYVKTNTEYYKIEDGNVAGNGSAGYATFATNYYVEARAASNPNKEAKQYWDYCNDFMPIPDSNIHNPSMKRGGVDFSDTAALWWILELGSEVDNTRKFWDRYVVNS